MSPEESEHPFSVFFPTVFCPIRWSDRHDTHQIDHLTIWFVTEAYNCTIAQSHLIKAPETFKSSVICIGLLLATEYKRSICVHHIFPHLERKVSRRSTVACVHHMRHPPRPKLWPDVTENSHIYIILLSSYKSYLTTDNMEPQLQKGTGTRYFTTSHPTFSHPGWDGMSLSTKNKQELFFCFIRAAK